jgi:hypothetical protein
MNPSHPEPFVEPGPSVDPEHGQVQPEGFPLIPRYKTDEAGRAPLRIQLEAEDFLVVPRINGEKVVLPAQVELAPQDAPPPLPRKQFRRGRKGPFASGRHLAAARTLAGLKQSELADLAGIHVNSLKRLEQMDDIRGSNYSQVRFRDALRQRGVVAESYPATVLRLEPVA